MPIQQSISLLSSSSKKWLMIMLLVVIAPQVAYVPLWLTVIAVSVIAWVGVGLVRQLPELSIWGRRLVVLGVIVGVLLYASASKGLAGLSSLLIAGSILKVLELRTRRDGWVLVLVACFIAAVGFLFNQSIAAAIYGGASLTVVFSALIVMHQSNETAEFFYPLKKSMLILLQSVPLMLILFLIFPRIAPLWSMQFQNSVAKTGLSDSMQPGNISQLARSGEAAFRVSFSTDAPPVNSQRYWRVMTYSKFDGTRWSMEKESVGNRQVNTTKTNLVDYQVIAEPSANTWLFALDYPSGNPSPGVLQLRDGTFRAASPVFERLFYQAKADLSRSYDGRALVNRSRYLDVPSRGNPMTRKMVNEWTRAGLSAEQKISALWERFNKEFSYTLSPQRLSGDRVDQFLFSTQEGFCEHFANATAYSLRLAGIPTRVVAGYLGGEWNPYEKYVLIRQYEAHAWVEVWLDGKGWVRLDPTAAVAPERVSLPFDQLFSNAPEFMAEDSLAIYRLQQNFQWLKKWNLRYDALNYSWHKWVLGYHEVQSNLLQDWFGKISILKMLLLLFIPVGAVLSFVIWRLLKTPYREVNELDQEVVAISAALAGVSITLARGLDETVAGYSQRITVVIPELEFQLRQWSDLYHQMRYTTPEFQNENDTKVFLSLGRKLRGNIKRLNKSEYYEAFS